MSDERELLLEDGASFRGIGFGATHSVAGEVVFATGMAGYVESLTDPSYCGQILVLTYPLQGNYGVMDPPYESSKLQVQGLVVSEAARAPSHSASVRSLAKWLGDGGVPGIEGVDTRALTKHIRERGTLRGWILPSGLEGTTLERARAAAASLAPNALAHHALEGSARFYDNGAATVLLIDAGTKESIVRELLAQGLSVLRVPFTEDPLACLRDRRIHGFVLGNGPGDPKDLPEYVDAVRRLIGHPLPMLGICLGCQILALAAGGDTYKLPYGHRSQNQPVRDLVTGRCYITSQNHGYAVVADSLPSQWSAWFENLNDRTSEGFRHTQLPIRAVQFHPEASPGPEDTRWLFEEFARDVRAVASGRGRS